MFLKLLTSFYWLSGAPRQQHSLRVPTVLPILSFVGLRAMHVDLGSLSHTFERCYSAGPGGYLGGHFGHASLPHWRHYLHFQRRMGQALGMRQALKLGRMSHALGMTQLAWKEKSLWWRHHGSPRLKSLQRRGHHCSPRLKSLQRRGHHCSPRLKSLRWCGVVWCGVCVCVYVCASVCACVRVCVRCGGMRRVCGGGNLTVPG